MMWGVVVVVVVVAAVGVVGVVVGVGGWLVRGHGDNCLVVAKIVVVGHTWGVVGVGAAHMQGVVGVVMGGVGLGHNNPQVVAHYYNHVAHVVVVVLVDNHHTHIDCCLWDCYC